MKTTNYNIHNYIKALTESITDILQKLTDVSSKTYKHDEQITDISSKLSYHEDRLNKMNIKDTQIHPFSLQITNTSSNKDKHEVQITSFTSKFSYYETRLDKLRTANINKIDTAIK